FLLLGAIIERVTGRLYRRYMTEEILNPLKMNRSTFSIEEVQKMCNVSVLYVYDKAKKQHEKQDWPGLGNYEVGGGIRSSVRDLRSEERRVGKECRSRMSTYDRRRKDMRERG